MLVDLTPQDESLLVEMYEWAVGAKPVGTRGEFSARCIMLMQKINSAKTQPGNGHLPPAQKDMLDERPQ